MIDPQQIQQAIEQFDSTDGLTRERARLELVAIGVPALPALCAALKSETRQVQWEAAKALSSISHASTAPALTEALEDNDLDIRWLAAEALLGLGRVGVVALLERLQQSNDTHFLENARHILRRVDSRYKAILAPVRAALAGSDADEAGMVAAYEASVKLQNLP